MGTHDRRAHRKSTSIGSRAAARDRNLEHRQPSQAGHESSAELSGRTLCSRVTLRFRELKPDRGIAFAEPGMYGNELVECSPEWQHGSGWPSRGWGLRVFRRMSTSHRDGTCHM